MISANASVAECMTKDFARIKPDMMVAEASASLIKKALLGGPVVDDSGKLLGWISEQECLQVTLQVVYHNTRVATVQDVMQTEVMTVNLNQDVLSIAEQMLTAKPKSYPVVDDDNKVIGVITRRHLLRMLDKKLSEKA
ncbi:CBS domain-containing protein [Paraglaciecola aquimarina]|uniref:CBS domain-containing protein n=1 Tax=Paraglaciecola aquimarina TaxID=1235557 RepID=A0ABU3SUN1_9ALTE|nr:CBS domain-containing protein [Paraglaciecola aquimarina]MDU0353705.1 CBS domain-containing protein [Paraglaciecola aquimarina]